MDKPADVKARRKALGWSRAELADRAGIDPRLVQLVELDQWSEEGALSRLAQVLDRAEKGELDVRLRRVQAEEGAARFGDAPPVESAEAPAEEPPRVLRGEVPEA